MTSLSAEIQLIAACCRRPSSAGRAPAISLAAGQVISWDDLLIATRRHRVEALVHSGLGEAAIEVPPHVGRVLAAAATTTLHAGLAKAAEEFRLLGAMSGEGIDVIFVKGTTLSVLAYGAIGVKSAKDIDLLAPHEDFLRACQVLTSLGYERRTPEPELSDAQFRRFMRHSHEAMFVHPGLGMVVDIHPSLVENPLLLPDLGLASPRQTVRISDGIELPTLALGPLFSYLCVHGAIHHWKRLKWLADVAALIGSDTAEIESLYREAVALGAGRCPAVALLLCHELLGTPLSPGFHEELKRDLNVTRLLKVSRFMIAGNKHDVNFDKRPATNLQIMQGNFLLASGWAYVLAELRHHAFYPGDRVLLAAPAFLRPLVRLLTLPGRWVRRIFLPAV